MHFIIFSIIQLLLSLYIVSDRRIVLMQHIYTLVLKIKTDSILLTYSRNGFWPTIYRRRSIRKTPAARSVDLSEYGFTPPSLYT